MFRGAMSPIGPLGPVSFEEFLWAELAFLKCSYILSDLYLVIVEHLRIFSVL